MKLYKGILQVVFANIISLLISVINGFVLPKYLPIEAYADLRTFLLYISYVGVLHLGYIDGIFIKYGGKTTEQIERGEFTRERRSLFWFQTIVTILLIIIAVVYRERNLLLTAICIAPINMVMFYKMFFQATGEFREYRIITNLSSALICVLNLFWLLVLKQRASIYYILIHAIVSVLVWLYYEYRNRGIGIRIQASVKETLCCIKENIQRGFVIMLGNFMGIWITSIDRWFVKILCGVAEFAYYSFAVTMLKLINVVITAFSVTLYNFFCKNIEERSVRKTRIGVLMIGAALIAIIYPLEFIISVYLKDYLNAVEVIRIIFAAQFVMLPINAVYLNIYKAKNMQKKYLQQMLLVTLLAFFTNVIGGKLLGNRIESFALATFFTAVVWLILCQASIKEYRMSGREWLYIGTVLIGYFGCSLWNVWIGLEIYLIWVASISLLFFGREIKEIGKTVIKKY